MGLYKQERDVEVQRQCNGNTDGSLSDNTNPMITANNNIKTYYFCQHPVQEPDRKASAKIKQQLQKEFKDALTGKESFDCCFSLQVKENSKPYQVPPKHEAYAL